MKKSTATLTFHAAHNYGSMLQAFALQHVITALGCDNSIINLRTENQKYIYRHPLDNKAARWKGKYIVPILNYPFRKALIRKYELFEHFLANDLRITPEMGSSEEVAGFCNQLNADYYIVGSDQVWNTACSDFDWSYFLPFAKGNAVAYAPSMGPKGVEQVQTDNYGRIKSYLDRFKAISVRERGTARVVEEITGRTPKVLVDPTFLLSEDEWNRYGTLSEAPLVPDRYIFLYSPGYNRTAYEIAARMSGCLKMPVVVSNLHVQSLIAYRSFRRELASGPWEFLNLIKNAALVVSGSFHAVAFSILLQTPFYAVDGDKDNRMRDILDGMGLADRIIHLDDVVDKSRTTDAVNFDKSLEYLERERKRSNDFLRKSLDIL